MGDVEVKLDRETYFTGDTVKGILNFSTVGGIKFKNFVFFAYGEELTKIWEQSSNTPGAAGGIKYSSKNVFFNQDLSGYLSLRGAFMHKDGTLEVPHGLQEIPFGYTIPEDTLESYDGKYVWITHGITVKWERKWRPDINKKVSIRVTGMSKKVVQIDRLSKEENNGRAYI
jgi:Arrestin (or S-antigen), N-terminal domain